MGDLINSFHFHFFCENTVSKKILNFCFWRAISQYGHSFFETRMKWHDLICMHVLCCFCDSFWGLFACCNSAMKTQ